MNTSWRTSTSARVAALVAVAAGAFGLGLHLGRAELVTLVALPLGSLYYSPTQQALFRKPRDVQALEWTFVPSPGQAEIVRRFLPRGASPEHSPTPPTTLPAPTGGRR